MTFTSKANTWDSAQLSNNLGNSGMIELSEADLDAVSGGTLGLLLYAKVSLVKKVYSYIEKLYEPKNKHEDDHHDNHHDGHSSYGKY